MWHNCVAVSSKGLMGRISSTFSRLRKDKKKALIPYLMAGDPSLEMTEALVLEIERAGADIIELGVPFSDPIADGPVIQGAGQRSLDSGTTLKGIFELVKTLRAQTKVPLVLMCYFNSILAFGKDLFCRIAVEVGVDGVIIPDLPVEEGERFRRIARAKGIDVILLLAPTSTATRLRKVAKVSQGFLYYVSLTGVTGARLTQVPDISGKVEEIRNFSRLPVAVGFGVSQASEASEISKFADGVIVGSALVKIIAQAQEKAVVVDAVGDFVRSLRKAM